MSKANGTHKITATKNYRLFVRSHDNRPIDPKSHRRLEKSMKQYGFLPEFPIVCKRRDDKTLEVKDGQHRLMFAETLGLPVYYVVADIDFDISTINNAAKTWQFKDYALMHAANGKAAYKECLEFSDTHKIALGTAAALLSGTTTLSNISASFTEGTFVVKDREWASSVAFAYSALCRLSPRLRNARLMEAIMACCRVKDFSTDRLVHNAEKCREKLVPYSTRDAYLGMIEEVYNFGRQKLLGVKAEALMAMRERNLAYGKKSEAADTCTA